MFILKHDSSTLLFAFLSDSVTALFVFLLEGAAALYVFLLHFLHYSSETESAFHTDRWYERRRRRRDISLMEVYKWYRGAEV